MQKYSKNPGESQLAINKKFIEAAFKSKNLSQIVKFLSKSENPLAHLASQKIIKNCPIAMTYTIEMLSRLSPTSKIEDALVLEY